MSSHPFSDDFISMLDAASHIAPLTVRDTGVFHSLEDAITRTDRPAAMIELALATWTTYLVKHPEELAATQATAPQLAAALYLAMDLQLSTGDAVDQADLLSMFVLADSFDESLYEDVAALARPIFSFLSTVTPDVLSVVIKQFRDQRHARNHPQHARELERLARAFWDSEPALDALDTLPRAQLILRLMVVPHDTSSSTPDVPEPTYFFVIKDGQSDAARAALPWYGELDELARMSALRRATLEAILAPHQGEPAVPVAIVAPEDRDIKPLMLKLGIPEIVILSPAHMP
jgi:hypothetical protein